VKELADVDLSQENHSSLLPKWAQLIAAFAYVCLQNFASKMPSEWFAGMHPRAKEDFAAYYARIRRQIVEKDETEFRQLVFQVLKVRLLFPQLAKPFAVLLFWLIVHCRTLLHMLLLFTYRCRCCSSIAAAAVHLYRCRCCSPIAAAAVHLSLLLMLFIDRCRCSLIACCCAYNFALYRCALAPTSW